MRIFKANFLKNKFWISILLIILSQLMYWFWIRNYTIAYFDSNSNDTIKWFSDVVENFYPRLEIEKHRFDASFFVDKSDQLALRFLFVGSIFSLFLLPTFYKKAKLFFIEKTVYSQKITRKSQYFLIIYFLLSNVLLSNEWLEILIEYSQIAVLYEPISFYTFLSVSFPSLLFLKNSFILLKVVSILGIGFVLLHLFFKRFLFRIPMFFCIVFSSILFIYLQGFLYGFGKIEHTYATWNWVCILFPIWFYQTNFNRSNLENKENDSNSDLTAQNYLLFLVIGLIYMSSGLEKVFIGKLDWINGNALSSYLQNSTTELGQQLSTYPFLVTLFSILTILWEISFFLILYKNKHLRFTLIFIGVCFHTGVYIFLNVGHYFSPWVWVYVFLLFGKNTITD